MWGSFPAVMQQIPLRGTYECNLDNRFRLAIPAKVRDAFVHGATMSVWFEGCAMLAPRHDWQAIVDRLFGELNLRDPAQRKLSRRLHAQSADQDALDRQGRVLVPEVIREVAALETKVVVVGNGDYLELWNPVRLKEFLDEDSLDGPDEKEVSTDGNRIVERAE